MAAVFNLSRKQVFEKQFERIAEDKKNQDYRNQQTKIQESNISSSLADKRLEAQRSVIKATDVKQTKRVQETYKADQSKTQKINNAKDLGARSKSLALVRNSQELPDTPAPRSRAVNQTPIEPPASSNTSFELNYSVINHKRSAVKAIQSESLSKADSVRNFSQKIILESRSESKRNIFKDPEKLNRI